MTSARPGAVLATIFGALAIITSCTGSGSAPRPTFLPTATARPVAPTPYPSGFFPDGTQPYEGLFLVRATAETTLACSAGAHTLHSAVACPGSIPYGLVACAICTHGSVFVLSGEFPAPRDFQGPNGAGVGALMVSSTTSGALPAVCAQPQDRGAVEADGVSQYLFQCPTAGYANWQSGRIAIRVTVEGVDPRALGLAKLIAESTTVTTG